MKKILTILAFSALAISSQAKVRLPHIICDNMVLQQQTDVRLWGWAQPEKSVKITTSWNNEVVSTKADKNGKWLVKVKRKSYTNVLNVAFLANMMTKILPDTAKCLPVS